MPIIPIGPDTPIYPWTLFHPDGVWIDDDAMHVLRLGLNLALTAGDPESISDCTLAYPRMTSGAIPARMTSGDIPARATSGSVPARVTNGSCPARSTSVVV